MIRAPILPVALVLLPLAAFGQVSTNQHALDNLAPATPHPHVARPVHAAHGRTHPASRSRSRPQPTQTPANGTTASRIGKTPSIPLHPPPPPIIGPPAIHVELHPPPPPPPVPVVAKAAGVATPIRNGIRITFGPGTADVNAQTDAALHGVATMLKAEPNTVTDVDAYAAGSQDDPSSPRRLSLARALAARAVLINDGVSSTRIYARALGASTAPASDPSPDGPADRLDIAVRNTDTASATPPPVKAASQ